MQFPILPLKETLMTAGKKEKSTDNSIAGISLTETGIKVGKALARSSFKVEDTGRRVRKVAGDIVGTVSLTKETPPRKGPFLPRADMTVAASLGFVAGDIYLYLQGMGATPADKLVRKITRDGNTQAMVYAAIGWLAREGKIAFSPDGDTLFLP
jgi:hypothetical protein